MHRPRRVAPASLVPPLSVLLSLLLALPLLAQHPDRPTADPAGQGDSDQGSVLGTVTAQGGPVGFAQIGVDGVPARAVADASGRFLVHGLAPGPHVLLVSAFGYGTAEVAVQVVAGETVRADVALEAQAFDLNPLVVTATRKQTFVSESPVKVDVVPGRFLQTMASNSLVESIQHVNGLYQQVDCAVCYTNNIRINGMEGPYTSVLIDGQPIMSSLASVYGLNGINPALVERIEIVKGPSSTLYGSDAMAGVINVITKDPRFAPALSVDLRRTDHGVTNLDAAVSGTLGPARGMLSGTLFRADEFLDGNGDRYADLTMDTRLSLFGKVHVETGPGAGLTVTGKYYHENRFGGHADWTDAHRGSDVVYGESIYTDRFELLGRWSAPFAGGDVAVELSGVHHAQDAMYGDTPYNADQQVVAGTLLWDRVIGAEHDLLVGLGAELDRFDDASPATARAIQNVTPGIFVQNEWAAAPGVKLLGGLRLDHHDQHGAILSPRAAVKLELFENNTIRLNGGTGFRVVDLFTEDYAALTHTRRLVTARDLDPERSYNLTLNVNHVLDWGNNPMMLDVDAFYTHFTNRIIPDWDSDPTRIVYENLDGFGVTRGIGVSVNQNLTALPLFYTLGITVQDVFYEDGGVREDELFAASYKGVWSATWSFEQAPVELDWTGTLVGPMRLPEYDAPFTRPTRSEVYALHNVMATWKPEPGLEVYAGARNLFDFTQPSPIVDPANPFGDSFDTAWVYGPVFGRNLVLGARWIVGR